jgi:hypothetical protein
VDTAAMVTLADYSMFTKQQLSESQEVVKLKGLGNQEVMGKLITKMWRYRLVNLPFYGMFALQS